MSWFDKHDHEHVFVTIVRDPYQAAVSDYYFIKRNNVKEARNESDAFHKNMIWAGADVNEYLENYVPNSRYSYFYDVHGIKDFECVGATDYMRGTIDLLNTMYSCNINHRYVNVNPNKLMEDSYDCAYPAKSFKKRNGHDYELYKKGLKVFRSLCRKYDVRYKENNNVGN